MGVSAPALRNPTWVDESVSGSLVLGLCNFLVGEGEDGHEGKINICEACWR